MAILVIAIEDISSLQMNEFFDYNGVCYALSRSRDAHTTVGIDLEDFYEATVQTSVLTQVPVLFTANIEGRQQLLGWYRKATVYRDICRVSVFLEGNVKADAREVLLLPEDERIEVDTGIQPGAVYAVIESDDSRYQTLWGKMTAYSGKNAFIRYDFVDNVMESACRHDDEACIAKCMQIAGRLMQDECQDIQEICAMEMYAEHATVLNSKDATGFYYLAMACHQTGRLKKGMKAIEKALRLEPDAADLMAMKGNLLVSMGHIEAAADLFYHAWQCEGDEDYLLLEGQAWLMKGQMDRAMDCLGRISDRQILERAGIHLEDMERRWPFVHMRGQSGRQ